MKPQPRRDLCPHPPTLELRNRLLHRHTFQSTFSSYPAIIQLALLYHLVTSWHKPMPYEVCARVSRDTCPSLPPESPVIYHSKPLQTLVWAAFPKAVSPRGRSLSSLSISSFHDLPHRSPPWRRCPVRAPRPVFLPEKHPKSILA